MEVRAGDRVILLDPDDGRRWLVLCQPGMIKEKGLGVFDPARLAGLAYGSRTRLGPKDVVILRPRPDDLAATLRRRAQIITAKDTAQILHALGIGPGDRVLESGIGSGAATVALAAAVGPEGRVVVQELREDFAAWAQGNLERAGLGDRVAVHLGDLTAGAAAGVAKAAPYAALLLDLPEPWRALDHAWPLLEAGARVACYCPQVSQMEQTVRRLEALGACRITALEVPERHWEVKERGSRPSFEGLGHTGFLVFAVRLPPT